MSKSDIRNSLECLCLPGPAIDSVMVEVSKFELEIERRRDDRIRRETTESVIQQLQEAAKRIK